MGRNKIFSKRMIKQIRCNLLCEKSWRKKKKLRKLLQKQEVFQRKLIRAKKNLSCAIRRSWMKGKALQIIPKPRLSPE